MSGIGEDTPICEFALSFMEVIEAPGSPAVNRRAMDFQQLQYEARFFFALDPGAREEWRVCVASF